MEQSPRLSLSYVMPSQAQKHVTVNETFRRLDALVNLSVKSRAATVEPASPSEGDAYIVPAGASGAAWDNYNTGDIAAFQDGAWAPITAIEGLRAWVADENALVAFDGAAWAEVSSGGGGGSETSLRYGVNTTADNTNRLSVKSDAALLSHDDVTPGTGDARQIINKAGAANTASVLFQDSFSGRAEFGLTGDDDFHVKVSGDGAAWNDAFVINKNTGGIHSVKELVLGLNDNLTSGIGGNLLHGGADGYCDMSVSSHDANGNPSFVGYRSRGTAATPAAVANNDFLFSFFCRGYDGAAYRNAAGIRFAVDGAPGASDMPARITFHTSSDGSTNLAERMRVTSAGDVGVGVQAPSAKLHIDGAVRVKSYTVSGAPSASGAGAGAMIFVSNESGGAVMAFSDGAAWRRVTDRAVIS